ncbi:hypothetical protein KM043_003283 [Ampulex compressa]|nr:hypothetical protein KM043_003283 [Ampulex compressa]
MLSKKLTSTELVSTTWKYSQQPNVFALLKLRNPEDTAGFRFRRRKRGNPKSGKSSFRGLNLMIKKDAGVCQEAVYTTEWMHNINKETNLHLRFSRKKKQKAELCVDLEGTLITTKRQRILIAKSNENVGREAKEGCKSTKPRTRLRSATFQDCRDRLRRKAECMREKRRKLYERESEDQRQQRLAQEAAKRREMRMYYETPEQKRKRLDAEAARKREYRMYSETPEDRRKRLDREAERRRTKRLSLYASETPEQRRERLNKESAKRREARLNQYAKETEEQRRERLRRDALRAREMRFTRSAIETEEERRQR